MIADTAQYLFGIQGKSLNAQERQWLKHPLCAGVILFTRNYDNPAQLRAFVSHLRAQARHDILVAVDHEGGRVQRFRQGFTAIPPMAALGQHYDKDPIGAKQRARDWGYVMAYEIADCDIDFSFAPVLDVQTDFSAVIGDRGFHRDVTVIGELAGAFYRGMREAGTAGVGKHFPGHGNVVADSHLELPRCEADFTTLMQRDLPPFIRLINAGIEAIMPAHIIYTAVDALPAGFSAYWLETALRQQLGFTGCIISDDLDMAGAAAYGAMPARIDLASRHCDLILLCNDHEAMGAAFAHGEVRADSQRQARLNRLQRDKSRHDGERYRQALSLLQ